MKDSGPKVSIFANGKWQASTNGGVCGLVGSPACYIAIDNMGKYRVFTEDGGWLPWVNKYDIDDFTHGCAGDGSAILGVEIPSAHARYAVHFLNGSWNPHMIGNYDTGGSDNIYAGDLQTPIDCVQVQYA